MNLTLQNEGWSTSIDTEPPLLTQESCAQALRHFFLNETALSVATEASSHPSGLQALYAQPWVWAGGGLGNIDECNLQTCLAGAGVRRDSLTFASVCMIPECTAHDLAADDFPGVVELTSQRSVDDALAQEYVTIFARIHELNKFLQTGWICGEFQVPWSYLPFGLPYALVCLVLMALAVVGTVFRPHARPHVEDSRARRRGEEEIALLTDICEEKKTDSEVIGSSRALPRDAESTSAWARLWSAFDASKHVRKLVTQPSIETTALDGLRVGSIFWIMLGHVMAIMSSSGAGYSNPANFLPPHGITTTALGQLLFSSRLAVDTFLCISGFLVVHVVCRKLPLSSNEVGSPFRRYLRYMPTLLIARVARILPLYIMCIGFYTQVAPHLGDGPFWYQWLSLLKPCHDYGIFNLLFIQNFVPWNLATTETCFYHSWYLAVDMQLFLVAPYFVFLFQENQRRGICAVIAAWSASVLITAYLSLVRGWSINTFDGAAVARFDVEAYAKPHVRAQAYLTGVLVAMLLPHEKLRASRAWTRKDHLAVLLALGVLALTTFISVAGAYARRPCRYTELPDKDECGSIWGQWETFLYTALSRTVWTSAIGVLMYCCLGRDPNGNTVASILSWRCWTPLSQLSFGVYLIHPIIIFVWQLGNREKQVFELMTFGMSYLSVAVVSFVGAFVAAVTVEFPCAALWQSFLRRTYGGSARDSRPAELAPLNAREYGSLQLRST